MTAASRDSFDVIVIGGGVAGAATALPLVSAGVRVAVVDAELEGRATAAGAGIVQPWASATTGAMYELYAAGAAHYPTLIEQLAQLGVDDIGFRRCGGLAVSTDDAALDDVQRRLVDRSVTAPLMGAITRLDSSGVREMFPPLAEELAGVHIAGGARVDGRLLCRGLLDAVRRSGGTVVQATVVLERRGCDVIVSMDGRECTARSIVIAGGAWSDGLVERVGISLPVEPQRGQIAHLRLEGINTSQWPSISPVGADHYMVAFDESRIVAGATRETGSGFDPRITAAGQRHVLDNALTLAPGLRDATLIETRVGLRPTGLGGQPVVGRFERLQSEVTTAIHVATGYGAIGLTIGPVCGSLLSAMILSEGQPPPLLKAFSPDAV